MSSPPPSGSPDAPPRGGEVAGWTHRIELDTKSRVPLLRQLELALVANIRSGLLRPGQRLPSSRSLASALGISRMTVNSAFAALRADGLAVSRAGSGTYVREPLPSSFLTDGIGRSDRGPPSDPGATLIPAPARPRAGDRQLLPEGGRSEDFPFRTWNGMAHRAARYAPDRLDYHPTGLPSLRKGLAGHLAQTRGIVCDPDRLVITNGLAGAVGLVSRVFGAPGASTWVGEAGPQDLAAMFVDAAMQVTTVRVDEEGMDIDTAIATAPAADLVALTTSRHFPFDVPLSGARRERLLTYVESQAAWIVEDDVDGEFVPREAAGMSLLLGDQPGRVIHVGGLGRLLYPVASVGFVLVPDSGVEVLAGYLDAELGRFTREGQPPGHVQATLSEFMSEGHCHRHIRRLRSRYRARRGTLVESFELVLGTNAVDARPSGLHSILRLPDGCSAVIVARVLAAEGLHTRPLEGYRAAGGGAAGLVIGHAAYSTERIREMANVLAGCWAAALAAGLATPG